MTYDIAIVMVTTDALHPDCLPSVRRIMEASGLRVCFVLVDHASQNINVERMAEAVPGAMVVHRDGNYGFGASCNRGAREVDARAYFFLNPDTILDDEQMLPTLFAFLQAHPQVGIVAPKVWYLDGRLQLTCRRFPKWFMPFVRRTEAGAKFGQRDARAFLMEDVNHDTARPVDWAQGSALLVDADLFRALGGFDERFFLYYEDVDLCRSAWDCGRAVYYLPDATVRHAYGQGSAQGGGLVHNLFTNPLARWHVASWIKYMLKWGVKPFV